MKLRVRDVIAATGGTYFGDSAALERELSFVTMDSREAGPDCLFLAIPGNRVDGHDFIPQVVEKGGLCMLCQRPADGANCVVVDSTTESVKALGAWYRRQFRIPIIGIVGSVGKTTAKEMVSAVLSQRFSVLKTEKNLNNELGVPLTLLRLREGHQAAVIEMGISDFGEMARLAEMVRPTMALYTVIGHSHLECLRDLDGVYRAKTELLPYLPADGVVFVNGDDSRLAAMDCPQRRVSFGLGETCEVRAGAPEVLSLEGIPCTIRAGERELSVEIPGFGLQMLTAAAEGAAVGLEFGLTDQEIVDGIRSFVTVGYRSQILRTGAVTIINDCYNSNPDSASLALASLSRVDHHGRKVCILGDMLELGPESPDLHYGLGQLAASLGIARVLACGTMARDIWRGAEDYGRPTRSRWYPDKAALLAELPQRVRPGDLILVKASRGMHFEEVTEALQKLDLSALEAPRHCR